jgi:ubiquinone/menaquinone biosynthesis C-methylase UbiE
MPGNSITAFDAVAADYDITFSQSLTGKIQRRQARKWLSAFLQDKKNLRILEINCGTGDDANWLASMGHHVIATDGAAEMIQQARKKASSTNPVHFFHCTFLELCTSLRHEKFDLIFSNFSGLNCVNADELRLLNDQFQHLLRPGGHLAVVIFGKYSWWESIYYLAKLNPGKAFRRWRKKPSISRLKEEVEQPVYCYSISRFRRLLSRFQLVEKRPVGLFIPPSYIEGPIQKNPRIFHWLEKLEKKAGGIAVLSQLADHSYLLLKKK